MSESGDAAAAEAPPSPDGAAEAATPSEPIAVAPIESEAEAPSPEEASPETEADVVKSKEGASATADSPSDDAAAAEGASEDTDAPSAQPAAAPPPPPPLALHPMNQQSSPPGDAAAASIVSEAASMTTSSTPAPQQVSDDASKPNLATVTSIVNQVLSQKERGVAVDVASLASAEVERFYDPNDGGARRSHPWNENGGGHANGGDEEAGGRTRGRSARSHPWNEEEKGGGKNETEVEKEALYPNSLPAGAFFSPRKFVNRRRQQKASHPPSQYDFDPDSPEFQDLAEELGIDARSHPHLRRPYRHVPSLGALLRSNVCQYCVIVVGLVGIAIGAAVGISKGYEHSQKRHQELHPYYEEEMEKQAGKTKEQTAKGKWWAKEHADADVGTAKPPSAKPAWKHEPPKKLPPEELEALYYKLEDAYLPVWFDRSSGWEGTTYKEAMDFCRSHDDFVPCPAEVYCPDQTGMGRLIFNEVFDDEKDQSWAPILDAWNEWIQVGNGFRQCAVFSDVYHERPGWGLEGRGKNAEVEKLTGHIMCCLEKALGDDFPTIGVPTQPDPNAADMTHTNVGGGPPMNSDADGGPPPQDVTGPSLADVSESTLTPLQKEIQDTYRPFWFDSNDGWAGGTYEDAQAFCESIPDGPDGETFHLCPIKVHCPRGFDVPKPLLFDMEPFEGPPQWSPTSNHYNSWVQVGKISGSNTCMSYMEVYHQEPNWGIDGTSPELKQHILCCQVYSGFDGGVQKGDQASPTAPDKEPDVEVPIVQITPTDVVASPQGSDMDEPGTGPHAGQHTFDDPVAALTKALNPIWYGPAKGWLGGSHNDAIAFCSAQGQELCPYAAICPHGPKHAAFEGWDDEVTSTLWTPAINKSNQWVMIGMVDDEEDTQCQKYEDLNGGNEPPWGLDGSDSEEKLLVLCCTRASTVYASAQPEGAQKEGSQPVSTQVEDGSHTGAGNSSPPVGKGTPNPQWYSTLDEGWNGGSHADALGFCNSKGKELCDYSAICPNGASSPPLEGSNAGIGEVPFQWSPVSNGPNQWVMIGMVNDKEETQCMYYDQLGLDGFEPPWGLDGSSPQKKKHLLCCSGAANAAGQTNQQQQQSEAQPQSSGLSSDQQQSHQKPVAHQKPSGEPNAQGHVDQASASKKVGVWFHAENGWNAGSHDDAVHYCALKEVNGQRMELCPYHEYCPSGPSRPPVEGRKSRDGEETEQWAPTSNGDNQWVMVGMHGRNKSTQCLTHGQLNGAAPSWGLDSTNQAKKRSILCCYKAEDS